MATKNSTLIDNFEAVPAKLDDAFDFGGRERVVKGTIAVAAADNDGDVLMLCPIHSLWKIHSIELLNDAITAGTDYDLGIYDKDGNVVDVNAYGDAIDMSSARVAPLDAAFEIRDINKIGQQVWQDAGLAARVDDWYYLALTGVTIGSAAGDISFVVGYTDGS